MSTRHLHNPTIINLQLSNPTESFALMILAVCSRKDCQNLSEPQAGPPQTFAICMFTIQTEGIA
eukprot:4458614-Amphidinium_carterae.1